MRWGPAHCDVGREERLDAGEYVERGAAVRLHAAAIGQQFAGVLEHDDAVAEQAPALLWVARDHPGRVMVHSVRVWTGGLVLTHGLGSPVKGVTKVTMTRLERYS